MPEYTRYPNRDPSFDNYPTVKQLNTGEPGELRGSWLGLGRLLASGVPEGPFCSFKYALKPETIGALIIRIEFWGPL